MKNCLFILVLATWTFMSCDSRVNRPAPVLTNDQISTQNAKVDQTLIPEGVPVASGIQHYICPNACAGSGGDAAGTCQICGSAYEHNDAYHNTPTAATSNTAATVAPTAAATTPEPAQNDAGIWHYTCSNGCSGGGGSAIACSQCGNTLAHNSAYHN